MRISTLVSLVRCKHWVKNVLVLFPIVFDGALVARPDLTAKAVCALLAFCFVSSAVYVLNDLRDVKSDRKHPTKCRRPIASGAVTPAQARTVAIVSIALFAVFGAAAAGTNLAAWACILAYAVTNVVYSMGLKHVPVLDVAILAAGFFLRVLYGALVTDIVISAWLYLTVFALSFYLGLGKRRNEYVKMAGSGTREVLSKYPKEFLDSNMTVFFALGLVFYSLWATDASTVERTSEYVIWTIPLVFVICLRYSFLVSGESSGDPVEVVFKDKVLLALIALFAVVMLVVIYAGRL